jgi:hypothetical protein
MHHMPGMVHQMCPGEAICPRTTASPLTRS